MELYTTLAAAIHSYTGLSPAAFFTVFALMAGVYLLVSSLFVSPDAAKADPQPPEAAPVEAFVPSEPAQLGDMTLQKLRAYDGSDPKKPLLIAIKGQIFDVTGGRMFYGPGGPYSLFAGRETSRALALMSFDPADLNDNLEDLSTSELEILHDWEEKFEEKYVRVGQIVPEKSIDGDAIESNEPAERS